MNYADADAKLGKRDSRKVANNTYMRRDGETIKVRLHSTDVLTYYPDGRVVFNTGGWKTVTTKDRLNTFGPSGIRISSNRGVWFAYGHGQEVLYADGMVWDGSKFTGDTKPTEAKRQEYEKKRIKKYVTAYMDALEAGKVPAPSGGDCWFCHLVTSDGTPMGDLGEHHGDKYHHIRDHMREAYYVPSLLANALRSMGASNAMYWWVGSYWDTTATEEQRMGARRWNMRKQVEKQLYRYIMRQLGHAT